MAAPGATEMVVVVTGGDPIPRAHRPRMAPGMLVVAADSGVDHALALGLTIDLAVGDFDSVTPEGLARARAEGARIECHPADKDATDLELALDAALAWAPARIHVLGGHGGRTDHLLGNVLLLASEAYSSVAVTAQMGSARLSVVRGAVELTGPVGGLVTLLAVHGAATGITTSGLRYPLVDDELRPGSSRGISNELTQPRATVRVDRGVLVAVQPHGGLPIEEMAR